MSELHPRRIWSLTFKLFLVGLVLGWFLAGSLAGSGLLFGALYGGLVGLIAGIVISAAKAIGSACVRYFAKNENRLPGPRD